MQSPRELNNQAFDLIVTIVNRVRQRTSIDAAREGGAEGATVVLGRGSGIHEKGTFLGIPIEPAKDLVLIVTPEEKTDRILESIQHKVELDKPGHGIGFVIPLKKVVGIADLGRTSATHRDRRGPGSRNAVSVFSLPVSHDHPPQAPGNAPWVLRRDLLWDDDGAFRRTLPVSTPAVRGASRPGPPTRRSPRRNRSFWQR